MHKADLPKVSGVYFVYEGTYIPLSNQVQILKLIYIGEAADVNDRIAKHEKRTDWLKHVRYGNELVFSVTEAYATYRNRIEAAYIFKHKPPVNTEYANAFPFDATTIQSSGKTELLNIHFTVYRTN
jgi:excinuclease UvrABC nuclease subunit